jgi:branched-chain amino acid transport system substrate-binding protein
VFLGGQLDTGGAAVIRALRDQLGDRMAILVPDACPPSLLIQQAGSAASGVFVSLRGIAGADQLPDEGRQFAKTFSATLAGETLEPSAIYAAQAMEVVLDAIRRSNGTRPSVLQALFETRIRNGLIGTVSFDSNGDIEASPVTILRVEPGARTHPLFPGAVVDRVLQVPVGLLH